MAALVRASAAAGPRVLYAGFVPFLARTVPMDALQFCLYEALQRARERLAAERGWEDDEASALGASLDMLLGGAAGGVSALLTMPLDTIKTHVNCSGGGLSFALAARTIWAASGPAGFFAGTSSRLLERVPSCAVYWLAAEATRRLLDKDKPDAAAAAVAAAAVALPPAARLEAVPHDLGGSDVLAAPAHETAEREAPP